MAEAPEDGDDSTIEGFFGTKNVRLTYIEGEQYPQRKIVFVDYANGGKAVRLKKPSDRENWNIDSPLISPDGKFVVYNMKKSENTWEAYVQELSENSKAVKIELTNKLNKIQEMKNKCLENRKVIVDTLFSITLLLFN